MKQQWISFHQMLFQTLDSCATPPYFCLVPGLGEFLIFFFLYP